MWGAIFMALFQMLFSFLLYMAICNHAAQRKMHCVCANTLMLKAASLPTTLVSIFLTGAPFTPDNAR
jgi:hypothetical protein